MIRAGLFALVMLGAAPAAAQDTAAQAGAAADRLAAASAMLGEAEGARDRVSALTETVRAYEDGLVALRDGLRRAAIRERAIEVELTARRDEIADLLGALQAMSLAPAPVLTLHPSGALGTARAGLIASEVTPALQARAEALRADLEEVAQIRALQDSAIATLEEGLEGAQIARAALSEAISERTDLPRRFTEDPVATALLLASTETLDGFASGLAQIVDAELSTAVPDASAAKGGIALPVQGQVLRGFGQADAAGVARPGLVIAAAPRALVSSPVAATLRFRGELLDYGNVAILEPAAGVLVVLAGLAEVYGETGEILPAGAPVGLMGGEPPGAHEILTESAQGGGVSRPETLYLEVREGDTPVDPATWFALE
ncbi:murein hydrolase activator EnvC family protein [Limimaricola pyoseonensis]|uniref:Septal ring factor EnvC, activator of murein hydrolases AmiA and AmiB n=1 Tax=Limimaricola pyoseonensis TaxID=521013 RepID=A0A1G7EGR2_9RHOB|nr:peptidoglycan DD-metalloendopeptidase family protein [Limimaricola pyoseonensis]SDE62635.1 Septal ring factor EnvC, activator of murein hydrolases AmiA and AmiB [Limimaricola pyoseonensis]